MLAKNIFFPILTCISIGNKQRAANNEKLNVGRLKNATTWKNDEIARGQYKFGSMKWHTIKFTLVLVNFSFRSIFPHFDE